MPNSNNPALHSLLEVANKPADYLNNWKRASGQKVIGVMPMNFPMELIAATGALPSIIQDDQQTITEGNTILAEFYCGYTRNIADQACTGRLAVYDAFINADHCIQLLGAVDIVRELIPEKPVYFEHLIAAMDDSWTKAQVREKIDAFIAEVSRITGAEMTDDALANAIKARNENRRLLRQAFSARREGDSRFSASVLQGLIKSSMVMDPAEHSAALRKVFDSTDAQPRPQQPIRLHLSGHFCHAPNPALFDLLEECGAIIVDDDLYTGARFISTDMDESLPPREALAQWYFSRNETIPCPTRVQKTVDWDSYLVNIIGASQADGVIVLMAKFCEAHMFYYPELRKRLEEQGIPHLLIETEHEGLPVETLRTRIEAMLERIRRNTSTTATTEAAS